MGETPDGFLGEFNHVILLFVPPPKRKLRITIIGFVKHFEAYAE